MSYITGIGIISAIGFNVEENLNALCEMRSGIAPLKNFSSRHNVPVGEVKMSNDELKKFIGLPQKNTYSRTTLLGLIAANEAIEDAHIDTSSSLRIGLISANSAGGMDLSENFYKEMFNKSGKDRLRNIVQHDCGSSTDTIATMLGINGFCTTISTACSSSANAIMLADRLLKDDKLDIAIAGGIDPLCLFTINGFSSLMILDNELCKPFDKNRAGLNLGEGAGFLVLQKETESIRKKSYCKLMGYANANDAYHQTATSPNGEGPYLAMTKAIQSAGIEPSDIDYINVHGTGTGNNDFSEGTAIKRIFGENVPPFSSTKVYTGHTLGAAGGIEAVFTALTVNTGKIFPTFNFANPIDELGISPITKITEKSNIRCAISNSFGFGGNVSSLVFSNINF